MEPVWTKSEKATSNCVDKSVAQYTGGIITTEKDLSSTSLGLAEGQMFPELAHLVIGLEGVSHQVCIDIFNQLNGRIVAFQMPLSITLAIFNDESLTFIFRMTILLPFVC